MTHPEALLNTVPAAQSAAFYRAVCEHLGIDPAVVSDRISVDVINGVGEVSLTAYLPADLLVDMFNAAGAADK